MTDPWVLDQSNSEIMVETMNISKIQVIYNTEEYLRKGIKTGNIPKILHEISDECTKLTKFEYITPMAIKWIIYNVVITLVVEAEIFVGGRD